MTGPHWAMRTRGNNPSTAASEAFCGYFVVKTSFKCCHMILSLHCLSGRPKNESKEMDVCTKIPSPSAEVSIFDHLPPLNLSTLKSVPNTPKRGRGARRQIQGGSLTSTPVRNSSTSSTLPSSTEADEEKLEFTEHITQAKVRSEPCFLQNKRTVYIGKMM